MEEHTTLQLIEFHQYLNDHIIKLNYQLRLIFHDYNIINANHLRILA